MRVSQPKATLFVAALTTVLFLLLSGCGGSDSFDGDTPSISVDNSQGQTAVRAGETFILDVSTNNFDLRAPADRDPATSPPYAGNLAGTQEAAHGHRGKILRGHGHDDVEPEHSQDEDLGHMEEHMEEEDDHAHGNDSSNPDARGGHYHVYLNDAAGSDSHITAWSHELPVALPHDIAPGTHSLRLELRDDNHVLVSSLLDEIYVFEVLE